MNKKLACALLGSSMLLASCATSSQVGMVSTRNIDYSATYTKGKATSHTANVTLILVIPVAIDDFNQVEVIDMAMKQEGYDFLTDVTVTLTQINAFVYMNNSLKVEGTGWKKAGATAEVAPVGETKVAYEVRKSESGYDLKKVNLPN
ncbi:MAG: hypothetical protein IPK50_23395 [Fibrobacterota bacterium]|nr:hypothetical protein [Fibrobacterota bacterium]QQS05179.1 MAG: hypothetical protein IPK50_23395 [Fibrobacterota bacterium]